MSKALFTRGGGEQIAVAQFQMRLGRIRSRVDAWTWAIQELLVKHPEARALEIMLTYKEKGDWQADHISRYLDKLRRRYPPQKLMAYAWVAELQERGAVHYHLLVVIAKEVFIDTPDKSGDWPHGWSGIQRKKNISGRYLVKYLQKGQQKDEDHGGYPKGCRVFAVVIRLLHELQDRTQFDYLISGWPRYLRDKTRELRLKLERQTGSGFYEVRRFKRQGDGTVIVVKNGWWYEPLRGELVKHTKWNKKTRSHETYERREGGGGIKLHYKNIYWLVFSEWKYIGNDDLDVGNWGDGRQTEYEEMY